VPSGSPDRAATSSRVAATAMDNVARIPERTRQTGLNVCITKANDRCTAGLARTPEPGAGDVSVSVLFTDDEKKAIICGVLTMRRYAGFRRQDRRFSEYRLCRRYTA